MAKKDGSEEQEVVAQEDEGLVEVIKDDETLAVHPTCVAAHVAAGWKVK